MSIPFIARAQLPVSVHLRRAMTRLVLLALCLSMMGSVLLFSACSRKDLVINQTIILQAANEARLVPPQGEPITVTVEIADTPASQQLGLMHRTALRQGQGMLFIFPDERPLSFWMKNTLIPLDILYFSAAGEFISAHSMEPCVADPCPTYVSGGLARYALEVNAGFSAKHSIGAGWRLIAPNADAQAQLQFAPGQRWAYFSRPSEKESTIIVLKTQHDEKLGDIVHIAFMDLGINDIRRPGQRLTQLNHLAVDRATLQRSVTGLLEEGVALPPFEAGLAAWESLRQDNVAKVYSGSLLSIVQYIDDAIQAEAGQ